MASPEEWRYHLELRLDEQAQFIQLYEDYYAGRHRMAFVTSKFREAFGDIFEALVSNWCEIVVDAPVERLAVEGFRFADDTEADERAWDIWMANKMPSQSIVAHTEAVKNGMAYVMLEPAEPFPKLTVEHPAQVFIEYAAGSRTQRLAAIKRWQGTDGRIYVNLFLPDSIHKWVSKEPTALRPLHSPRNRLTRSLLRFQRAEDWEIREEAGPNPLGEVPVWEIANRPTMLDGGRSDLTTAIPLQDAINKEIADMLLASEFASFPQRVLMGVEIPTDENGDPLSDKAELKAAISRLWTFEDPDVKIDEFNAADLSNYTNAVTLLLQHLAAQTRTPPHYLLGQIVNASGDALKAAETGLVSKVQRKQIDFAEGWSGVMSSALGLSGAAPSDNVEVIWRDPEFRSEGEQVDAAVKLATLGVPYEALWERVGATPQQVTRWSEQFRATQPTSEPAAVSEWLDSVLSLVRAGDAEGLLTTLSGGYPEGWDARIDEMTYAGRDADLAALRTIVEALRSTEAVDETFVRSLIERVT